MPGFRSHPYKKEKCTECLQHAKDHRPEALSDDDILVAIAQAQGADGGHLILPAEHGLGIVRYSLHASQVYVRLLTNQDVSCVQSVIDVVMRMRVYVCFVPIRRAARWRIHGIGEEVRRIA